MVCLVCWYSSVNSLHILKRVSKRLGIRVVKKDDIGSVYRLPGAHKLYTVRIHSFNNAYVIFFIISSSAHKRRIFGTQYLIKEHLSNTFISSSNTFRLNKWDYRILLVCLSVKFYMSQALPCDMQSITAERFEDGQ